MNHFLNALCIFALSVLPFKCTPDQDETKDPDPVLELKDTKDINISADGGSQEISFTTNEDWKVTSNANWATANPASGVAGEATVRIEAAANESNDERKAVITVLTRSLNRTVSVIQAGKPKVEEEKKYFSINQTSFDVSYEATEIFVNVKTNVDFEYHIIDSEWIEDKTQNAASGNLKFLVTENKDKESRKGTISICASTGQCYAVSVLQEGNSAPGDASWLSRNFYHKSLAMRFTATWCGYCPNMNTAIENAMDERPNKIEYVALHGNSSNLYFSGTDALMTQYGIEGFPTGIMDGRAMIQNYAAAYTTKMFEDVLDETEAAYPTTTGVSFTSSLKDNKVSVDLNLYAKAADKYKVTIMVLEDNIVGYQAGASSNYNHICIARVALTNVKGEDLEITDPAKPWSKSYSATLPSGCDKNNLRVLVYVQKPFGKQTVAKGVGNVVYGNYGSYYVDNATSAKVGHEKALAFVEE